MRAAETTGSMSSPWRPRTVASTSATGTPASCASASRNRALSRVPAMPSTRSRGNPVTRSVSAVISSRGLVTTTATAAGAAVRTASATAATGAPVRLLKIGTAHARSARAARGDDHDLGSGEEGEIGAALGSAGGAGDPGRVVQVERDGLRETRDDVDDDHFPGHATARGQVRHAGADGSCPDHGDAPEAHRIPAFGGLRRHPLRAAPIQPSPQRGGPVRPRHGRAVERTGAQRHVPSRGGVARQVGDDAARQHLDVPAPAAARPLHVLGTDDASLRSHGACHPSRMPMACRLVFTTLPARPRRRWRTPRPPSRSARTPRCPT